MSVFFCTFAPNWRMTNDMKLNSKNKTKNKITTKCTPWFNNLRQRISALWQDFRAWQEHPISYHLDETEHVCHNCGHTFRGNYCPVCSQSAKQGRISWAAIYQGIAQLWGIESRSAVYTIWQLFLRPGYLVRDYISGKRQVSYPPVKLLFILAAVVTLVRYFFPVPAPEPSQLGFKYLDLASDWLTNHQNISELLQGCIVVLPTWFFFRKAPLYPKHTIPEGFYLQVYLAILSYIFYSVFVENISIAFVLSLCYYFIAYKQLFGYNFWGTLWRLTLCFVLSFSVMLLIAMLTILISKVLVG